MRQSALRIVFALLITAVGASLLIGTVSADGSVPRQPPGSDRVPMDLYDAGTDVMVEVTYADPSVPPQTRTWSLDAGASMAGVVASINGLMASSESGCTTAKITKKIGGLGGHGSAKFYSQTWWCWDSRVITDGPRLSAWGKSSGTVKFKGVTYKAIDRGGRGHSYADDRAEGKFCGFYCVTAWITRSINAQGRLTSSNSGVN